MSRPSPEDSRSSSGVSGDRVRDNPINLRTPKTLHRATTVQLFNAAASHSRRALAKAKQRSPDCRAAATTHIAWRSEGAPAVRDRNHPEDERDYPEKMMVNGIDRDAAALLVDMARSLHV